MMENIPSVYKILATYVNQAQRCGDYIKGHIDEKDKLDSFLSAYNQSSKSKFIIRSSCKKNKTNFESAGSNITCTRYGRADRIYWEFNNRNLVVPFTGIPFVSNSSQIKVCEHGSQYYKLKSDKQQMVLENELNNNNNVGTQLQDLTTSNFHHSQSRSKRRRMKPTKKRNCPAYMCIREVVMFPEYILKPEYCCASKHNMRKEKSAIINRLREALGTGKCATLHRFYVQIPLPEAHTDHPFDSHNSTVRILNPFVRQKIDELLKLGLYEKHHIRLIANDFIREEYRKLENAGYPPSNFGYATQNEIDDYIYLSSILTQKTVQVQIEGKPDSSDGQKSTVQENMEKSIQELLTLIQNCQDKNALIKAKAEMRKVIQWMKRSTDNSALITKSRKRTLETKNVETTNFKKFKEFPLSTDYEEFNNSTTTSNNQMLLASNNVQMVNDLIYATTNSMHENINNIPSFSRLMEADPSLLPGLLDPTGQFHTTNTLTQQTELLYGHSDLNQNM